MEDSEIICHALKILSRKHHRKRKLDNPHATRQYLQLKLSDEYNEVFGCIFLDNRHRILSLEVLFYGTIDGASVHPRVVVKRALDVNAAAIVFFHNHPSGVAEPSRADQQLTRRLVDALGLVDIRVLDHLVVSPTESISMAERGLI